MLTPSNKPFCLSRLSATGGCVVFLAAVVNLEDIAVSCRSVRLFRCVGVLNDGWLLVLACESCMVVLSCSVRFSLTVPGESHLMTFVVVSVITETSGNGPAAVGRMVSAVLEAGAGLFVELPEGGMVTMAAFTLV